MTIDWEALLTQIISGLIVALLTAIIGYFVGSKAQGRAGERRSEHSVRGGVNANVVEGSRGDVYIDQSGQQLWVQVQNIKSVTRASSSSSARSSDDPWGEVTLTVITFMVIASACAVVFARYWSAVLAVAIVLTLLTLLVMAFAWADWPKEMPTRNTVAVCCVVIGGLLLLTLHSVPGAVGDVPGFKELASRTGDQSFRDAMGSAIEILGVRGLMIYLFKFLGVAVLSAFLVTLGMYSLAVTLVASDVRRQSRSWRSRLAGAILTRVSVGNSVAAIMLSISVVLLAIANPQTAEWLMEFMQGIGDAA